MVESFTDKQGSFLSPLVFDIYVVTYSILQRLLCCSASCTSCVNYVIFRLTPRPAPTPVHLRSRCFMVMLGGLLSSPSKSAGNEFRGVLLHICRSGLGSRKKEKENYRRNQMHHEASFTPNQAFPDL